MFTSSEKNGISIKFPFFILNSLYCTMNDISRAITFRTEFLAKNPSLKEEVNDLFQLMRDEIEEGGSVDHEINLFIGSCEDLLN